MKNFKISSAVLCMILFAFPKTGISQDKVLLKTITKPNSTYTMVTVTESDMVMDIKGAKEVVDAMKSAGLNFPLAVKGQQTSEMTTVVKDVDAEGYKPSVISMSKGGGFSTVNGQKIEVPNRFGEIKVFARIDGDENVKLDSIVGNIPSELKDQMAKLVTKKMVIFPNHPVGVGDTFDNEFPMEMPVSGMKIEMVVKSKYKVRAITATEVTLDVKQKLEMNMSSSEKKMKAELQGGGNGIAVYDRVDGMLKNFETLIKMDMTIDVEGAKMILKGDTDSKVTVSKS